MTDISKCAKGCDRQAMCYRWTAPVSKYHQSYADFKPHAEGECDHFWDNRDRKDDRK